jgi:hypothetical protein
MAVFDMLMSADFMVHDADHTADVFVKKLGLYGHPKWRHGFTNHTYIAHFLRVHRNRTFAPTLIEPQAHLDKPNTGDPVFPEHLKSLEDFMGKHRPIITHSNVQTTDNLPELIEKLARRRLPFRIAPWTAEQPTDRMWVGMTPENPRYEPSVDGGLCIEVITTKALQMPADTFDLPTPQPAELAEGEMVRCTARGWIVRDLDDTLRRISSNLDWEPRDPVVSLDREGYRMARMGYVLENSATLDIIEPTRYNSRAGYFLHNWGPGPFYARIAVKGLDAKAEDLRSRGTRFTIEHDCESAGGGRVLHVDPQDLEGAVFEFVEHEG